MGITGVHAMLNSFRPEVEGWGITVTMRLPGGVEVMLYEPRHPTATGESP